MGKKHFWHRLPIIASVVIVLLISVGFYACSNQPGSEEEKAQIKESYNDVFANSPDFFIYKLGNFDFGNASIFVDKKTRVEYIYTTSGATISSAITVRVDSLGKPILYEGDFPD